MQKVYLDTSVISALFDMRTPERLTFTKAAWERLLEYDVYISTKVIEELNRAPFSIREKMMEAIHTFTVLQVTEDAEVLARSYVAQGIFPEKYYDDALHVALASIHQIGILLSWNFTHLVKIKTRRMVALINTMTNRIPVEIISPPEL